MKPLHIPAILILVAASAGWSQAPTATPVCVEAGPDPNHMTAAGCNASAPTPSQPAMNTTNPAMQGAANALGNVSYQLGYKLGQWLFGGSNNADNAAAAAAAAEAEREQQDALARQEALREQQRQAMFDRLSHELKMSAFGDMQLKGFDNSAGQMQLKGFSDTTSNTGGGEMALKGFGDSPSSGSTPPTTSDSTTPVGGQTCFFGECGPQNPDLSEPIEPWNDPKVVDLRDVQDGAVVANLAVQAPPADRQMIMDQALAVTNGVSTLPVPATTTLPQISDQGLLEFQQANAAYRQAHDSAYSLQVQFNQYMQQQNDTVAMIRIYEQQLENDLRNNSDSLTLAQQQEKLAQIFDAALMEKLAYGRTYAELLAARQQYYQTKYADEMVLWKAAGGPAIGPPQVTPPPPPPPPTTGATSPDYGANLQLALPPVQGAQAPTQSDLQFLHQLDGIGTAPVPTTAGLQYPNQVNGTGTPGQTQGVVAPANADLQYLQQLNGASPDVLLSAELNTQEITQYPPQIVQRYNTDPAFQQEMNAQHQSLFAERDQAEQQFVQQANAQVQQGLAALQNQGVLQPGTSPAAQAQTNPPLTAQLSSLKQQVEAKLNYQLSGADYETQNLWQQWINQQATQPQSTPAVGQLQGTAGISQAASQAKTPEQAAATASIPFDQGVPPGAPSAVTKAPNANASGQSQAAPSGSASPHSANSGAAQGPVPAPGTVATNAFGDLSDLRDAVGGIPALPPGARTPAGPAIRNYAGARTSDCDDSDEDTNLSSSLTNNILPQHVAALTKLACDLHEVILIQAVKPRTAARLLQGAEPKPLWIKAQTSEVTGYIPAGQLKNAEVQDALEKAMEPDTGCAEASNPQVIEKQAGVKVGDECQEQTIKVLADPVTERPYTSDYDLLALGFEKPDIGPWGDEACLGRMTGREHKFITDAGETVKNDGVPMIRNGAANRAPDKIGATIKFPITVIGCGLQETLWTESELATFILNHRAYHFTASKFWPQPIIDAINEANRPPAN